MYRIKEELQNWRDLVFWGSVCFLALLSVFAVTCEEVDDRPWMTDDEHDDADSIGPLCDELIDENMSIEIPMTLYRDDRLEYDLSPDVMEREVIELWELFFEDGNAPQKDRRRSNFGQYAYWLVESIMMYQDNPTDIGGRLPKHRNAHLVAAQMITIESSVAAHVVGKKGEVGLMQLMPRGPALAGHSPLEVLRSPELGILLGVRWLAHSVGACAKDIDDWDDEMWLGPLSYYSGGTNAVRKNGTCKEFQLARRRLRKTLLYRSRIDAKI